jgi:type II secretory pathway pseudopilin PulG
MRRRRTLAALAALSGLPLAGTLAGCSVAPSMSAHALAEAQAAIRAEHSAKPAASTSKPTTVPTIAPTATPAAKTLPTSTPTPHTSTKPKPSPSPKPTPTPTPTPTYLYTDGTYSAKGTYVSPGGSETIRVTVSIANDIVQTVSVHGIHVDSTAQQYEAMFESGISAVAVGKDLATLNVGAVGGSSLTCVGFNAAIVTIRGEAQN